MRSPLLTPDRIQFRLLVIASLYLLFFSLALSISPAVRARSWQAALRWEQWIGLIIWLAGCYWANREIARRAPERDPYLLPVAALLSGWGILTIWRLYPAFGLRQSVWLIVAVGALTVGLHRSSDLHFLRRYKYLWLTGSLLLTALTVIFGTNPLGSGPRMWLGCCGLYLQPSEPLKLLLIAYLAAYLADRYPSLALAAHQPSDSSADATSPKLPFWRTASSSTFFFLLSPTLIMTGLALAILVIQRDLGTASMFIFLYAAIIYVATGQKRVLLVAAAGVVLAGVAGYWLFDVVRVRVDAWLNPWIDPSGRSYQIVQALLAVANGGLLGRGPGMGNPGLVPVPHSDLIFAAIAEEHGMIGAAGLFLLMALLAERGVRAALRAPDAYRRFLAAGLTAYLVGQGLLIISGTLRLLPLTGITFPFVSYGGSSLLVSWIALYLLIQISAHGRAQRSSIPAVRSYKEMTVFLFSGLGLAALACGWWGLYRAGNLLARTDNPRRAIDDRFVKRGALLDRNNLAISDSFGEPGQIARRILYPDLSAVTGYINPTYGQAGLEASMDDYLRGLRGNPGLLIWWTRLLYAQPPPGLDVRLSLDLHLQRLADEALQGQKGALVLMNAQNGEILAMASHPTFDANRLDETWQQLVHDPDAPLLNRATLGLYPGGTLIEKLFTRENEKVDLNIPAHFQLPSASPQSGENEFQLTPLQASLAAAILSNRGVQPAPALVLAVNTPQAGWVPLPALEPAHRQLPSDKAEALARSLAVEAQVYWQVVEKIESRSGKWVAWYLGGSLPEWVGAPIAIALVIEQGDVETVTAIGQKTLSFALSP